MKDFSIAVMVDAPPHRVWEVLSDIERWPDWTPTVTSVRRTNSGPMRIGAKARVRQPRLPAADWVVTALTEGRSFDWESRAPGVRVIARHAIEASGEGSRVTLTVQFSGLLGNVFGRATASLNRRYIALEADGLKRRAEGLSGHA
jgi:carbon monoxide dehydrogenase subunit G